MSLHQEVVDAYRAQYGDDPELVVCAPGRVNLIGEHTDYNDGFVLPMAIDRAVWIALNPRADQKVAIYSLDFKEQAEFGLEDFTKKEGWIEYVKGVAHVLQANGYILKGWQGVITSDVPIGAGLSSSAAIEMATARSFAAVSPFDWEPISMAKFGQAAENQWIGVNCGIMDQMISAAGQAGHALLIDCRTLDYQPVPLPADTAVAVLDTTTRRGLSSSAYNERRSQCEKAAEFFGVPALRDVSIAQFDDQAGALDELTRRRARHVISENERTVQAADVLKQGDAERFGQLMNASHASLRDDYEVSCPELNAMVDSAGNSPGCLGARMTGAGFGGCAVALVDLSKSEDFIARVTALYTEKTGMVPNVYLCRPSAGAGLV